MNSLVGKNGVSNASVGNLIRKTYHLNNIAPVDVELLSMYKGQNDETIHEFMVSFDYKIDEFKNHYVIKFVNVSIRDEY